VKLLGLLEQTKEKGAAATEELQTTKLINIDLQDQLTQIRLASKLQKTKQKKEHQSDDLLASNPCQTCKDSRNDKELECALIERDAIIESDRNTIDMHLAEIKRLKSHSDSMPLNNDTAVSVSDTPDNPVQSIEDQQTTSEQRAMSLRQELNAAESRYSELNTRYEGVKEELTNTIMAHDTERVNSA